ncbi:MAG: SWIM zinc finger family protein [Syntrophomonadaceae bacterium]|nr:SWIM zinc finger family protein [Syntrophomonadaceae bacterium]MDD3023350.1 SWIM zinc finger family protein [Syntrophomonadaceae bacterium]
MNYDDYSLEYVTKAERRKMAQKSIENLKKKGEAELTPVIMSGRQLARSWWGKAWNDNLERYADYSSRIGRGRSYVRHGAVLDLKIEQGIIKALVQGSVWKPYEVEIIIRPLLPEEWGKIRMACEGKIESLQELIDGKFPSGLSELFTAKGSGLFPAPKEINFNCSCPDRAVMCKHVAAVLYGIGARLDEDPAMFFTLRAVDIHDLISKAIQSKTQNMLSKSGAKSRRILADADIAAMFGVEVEAMLPGAGNNMVKKGKKKRKQT